MLDLVFDFHDEHSRITTPSPLYDGMQSVLSCIVEELEPLRGIEDKTVAEAFAILMPMFVELMDHPDNFLMECNLDAFAGLDEFLSQ